VPLLLQLNYQRMPNKLAVTDPFGKKIYLLPHAFKKASSITDSFIDVSAVITKPAVIVQVDENNQTQFCYFRSVGWNKTFLIMVHHINNHWEAFHCIKNPAGKILSIMLERGKQLL
jgi:hypothetical protein